MKGCRLTRARGPLVDVLWACPGGHLPRRAGQAEGMTADRACNSLLNTPIVNPFKAFAQTQFHGGGWGGEGGSRK